MTFENNEKVNLKIDLRNLNQNETCQYIEDLGEKRFRGKQVFSWVQKGITDFDELNNIPKMLREKFADSFYISNIKILEKKISKIDETIKYLLELGDGNVIEAVLMKYKYGYSLCVSSQVGCRMGCSFCASTLNGLVRSLSAGEILGQLLTIQKDIEAKIGHIVLMGIGEPFDNYDNVTKFFEIVNDKDGINLGLRNITVSTCGVVDKIMQLAEEYPQINLAISLHSAIDEVRTQMMPINKKYNLEKIIDVCRQYIKKTNRRITFEYTLVKGKNDSKEAIDALVKYVRGLNCHINLIPLNQVVENGMQGLERKKAKDIADYLESRGVSATVRRQLGADIDGACGQLRMKREIATSSC
ncbi:MAG: 23S rRNA (adenine(2503)-C(2))-methyltransferase RlmN [Eubacteriales bacterium]|nr:23S rRNA (adenine(2503)-C(2))-methyltransferase RlmN [Eubacteriales bacterium]MDY3332709.1 23S rRNA (adenine(2503)-C(2))-methyltransferase RlmN [Gallibacter sp.]